jgi:hypothetical protein
MSYLKSVCYALDSAVSQQTKEQSTVMPTSKPIDAINRKILATIHLQSDILPSSLKRST